MEKASDYMKAYRQGGSHDANLKAMLQVNHEELIKTIMSFIEFIVINSRSTTLQFKHV